MASPGRRNVTRRPDAYRHNETNLLLLNPLCCADRQTLVATSRKNHWGTQLTPPLAATVSFHQEIFNKTTKKPK